VRRPVVMQGRYAAFATAVPRRSSAYQRVTTSCISDRNDTDLRSSTACAKVLHMEVKLKYRGREVNACDAAFIQALIAEDPGASRRCL
jgi:hypothetical protein